jgi:hypothetical protein
MDSRAVKVGVILDRRLGELGEWFADATALEAAGADALWLDPSSESELDPLAVLAALAARTSRSLLIGMLPASDRRVDELARTLVTIARLSHGRLALVADREWPRELRTILTNTNVAIFHQVPEGQGCFEHRRQGDEVERWVQTSSPESRAAWRAALASAAERGVRGLLVPAGPRLLDILRNPDDPGGRGDLHLAQG